MKSLYPVTYFLAVLMTACQSTNSSETATDSTNVQATDSLATQEQPDVTTNTIWPATPPVISNLPGYSGEHFTDDSLEAKVTDKLIELLDEYDKMPLLKVSRYFDRSYEEPTDQDENITVSENETQTWYYDSTNHLKAYSVETGYRFSENIYTSKTSIYLYAGVSLIAFYEDEDISLEMAAKRKTRAVMSGCSDCIVYIADGYDEGYSFSATPLDASHISEGTGYFVSQTGMLDIDISDKSRSEALSGSDYIFTGDYSGYTESSPSTPVTYSVQYNINAYLFSHFMDVPEEEGD